MMVLDVSSITDEQLDTIDVKKKLVVNDYSMIGIQYGAGLSQVMWNPTQKQDFLFSPVNVGVTFTTYQKMFGYMPFFGFQAGLFYAREGYQFEYNEDKNYIYTIEGAEKAVIDVLEAPLLFQFHYDRVKKFTILRELNKSGIDTTDIYDPRVDFFKIDAENEKLNRLNVDEILDKVRIKLAKIEKQNVNKKDFVIIYSKLKFI